MYQSVSESTPSVSKEGTYNLFFPRLSRPCSSFCFTLNTKKLSTFFIKIILPPPMTYA